MFGKKTTDKPATKTTRKQDVLIEEGNDKPTTPMDTIPPEALEAGSGNDHKSVEEFEYGDDNKTQNTRNMEVPKPKVPAGDGTPKVKPAKPAGRTVKPAQQQGV